MSLHVFSIRPMFASCTADPVRMKKNDSQTREAYYCTTDELLHDWKLVKGVVDVAKDREGR